MSARSFIHALNAGLLAAHAYVCFAGFGRLPDRIPTHFGLDGTADAWGAPGFGTWFLMLLISAGTAGLIYVCAWWIGRRPSRINVPAQKKYDALTPERKAAVVRSFQSVLHLTATPLLLLFAVLQLGTYQTAVSGTDRLPDYATVVLIAVLAASLLSAPLILWYVSARVDRAYREQQTQ